MKYALFWSGGKDSLLALDRGRHFGLDIQALVNLYEGDSGRVRFHRVRKELIAEQAKALDLRCRLYWGTYICDADLPIP